MTGPNRITLNNVEFDLEGFASEIEDELRDVVEAVLDRSRAWTAAVIAGDLSLEEFKDLIEGEKDLLEMSALQKSVEAKVLAGTLKNALLEKLVEIVGGVVS